MTGMIGYDDLRHDTVIQVAKLVAGAAITAPESRGQLFSAEIVVRGLRRSQPTSRRFEVGPWRCGDADE